MAQGGTRDGARTRERARGPLARVAVPRRRLVGVLGTGTGPFPGVGAALIAIAVWAIVPFMSESTPWGALLAFHVALSAGLSLMFTSLFSASLGSLPPHLYSHGSATLATVQQVAGAAGTAALVSTMSAVALARVAGGASETAGLAGGVQVAFIVAAVLTTVGFALTWFVPRGAPGGESGHSH